MQDWLHTFRLEICPASLQMCPILDAVSYLIKLCILVCQVHLSGAVFFQTTRYRAQTKLTYQWKLSLEFLRSKCNKEGGMNLLLQWETSCDNWQAGVINPERTKVYTSTQVYYSYNTPAMYVYAEEYTRSTILTSVLCTCLTYEVYYGGTPQPPAGVPQGVHPAYSSAPPGKLVSLEAHIPLISSL